MSEVVTVVRKRNIGSLTRHWRHIRHPPGHRSSLRHLRQTTQPFGAEARHGGSNDNFVFIRSYRANPENEQFHVDLRTEALMRGMG